MTEINANQQEFPSIIQQIQDNADYKFKNPNLLDEALTHPSFASEHPDLNYHNQRLEFLGDAVLQIILTDYLYKKLPNEQEGVLTRIRSYLANEDANTGYTLAIGLDHALKLGKGEDRTGGRQRTSILGDVFEAFLGAIYLDGGIQPATHLVMKLLPNLETCRRKLAYEENPKGSLQKLCLKRFKQNVQYQIVQQSGPSHAPSYIAEVSVNGKTLGSGTGRSHKDAERLAAIQALLLLLDEQDNTDISPQDMPKPSPENQSDTMNPAFKPIVVPAKTPQKKRILALDFDGVICDSATETGASAWKVARTIWPELFPQPTITDTMSEAFVKARPFLETGYQSIPMMKLLAMGHQPDFFKTDYLAKIMDVMDQDHLTKNDLVKRFGDTRDEWIKSDFQGWLAIHGVYEGTIDALKYALENHKVLILTTKQERFVKAILLHYGVDFPDGALYGLDRKISKDTVLATLVGAKKTNIHFVEDRFETLQRIKVNKALTRVKLHYANWGYGTPDDEINAQKDSRINMINLQQFIELLTVMPQ